MSSIKFKNKIRGKSLEHVISLCEAIVLAKEVRKDQQPLDLELEDAPPYTVDISHIKVSKVIFQKRGTPPLSSGIELPVFPAALPRHVEQFKLYYEKRTKKSCIYESYTCEDDKPGERFYFINFTCFGWCFVCLNSSEAKSKEAIVKAQIRGCFLEYNG